MGKTSWSPTEKMLYVAVVPIVAVVAALAFIGLASSEEKSAAHAQPGPAAVARQRSLDEARAAQRKAYQECLESMGADLGRSRFRSRFSPRPDMAKVREAMTVCRVILQNGGPPAPGSRKPSAPPIA